MDSAREIKVCKKCLRELPRSSFSIRQSRPGVYKRRPRCRECEALATREHRNRNPGQNAASKKRYNQANPSALRRWAKRRFCYRIGIDPNRIEEYIRRHHGKCEICGGHTDEIGTLALDHDHKTGVFRGLLCSSCNLALGQFGDDAKRLESAIAYLRKEPPNLDDYKPTVARMPFIDESDDRAPTSNHGERVPWAKLTLKQVQEIRQRSASGETPLQLAKEFCVSRSMIYSIRAGKSWKRD